ncbi:unnamed protein product [Polarella glacialis]|uniref:RNA-editing substrate-binding complex 6 protein domain-containing protein n=1 Tax=Polarella glacialis TaxID=89957 RepID=A0A813FTT2_POLGL|nr:unnamed protein product [Polarella glacialis]
MNLVNFSTAIHRLARLSAANPGSDAALRRAPTLKTMLIGIASAFSQAGKDPSLPQSLSNVTWSIATLRIVDTRILELAASLAVLNMKDFKNFELSSLLWSYAKLGTADSMVAVVGPLFRAATNRLIACSKGAGFRSLATAAWAFATARQASQRLFRCISQEACTCLSTANSQEMANLIWACSTVGHKDEVLFNCVAQECVPRLEEFKAQELSNTFWGFASNDFYHEAFFQKALALAQDLHLQPQHMANIIWAAARLKRKHPASRAAVLRLIPKCGKGINAFKPQEIASVAQGVAKIFTPEAETGKLPHLSTPEFLSQFPVPPQVLQLFAVFAPLLRDYISVFSDQSLANLISSFGMLGLHFNQELVAVLEHQVMTRAPAMDNALLITVLRACTQSPQLFRLEGLLATRIGTVITQLKDKELRSLDFTRSVKLGVPCRDEEPSAADLLRWCQEVSGNAQAGVGRSARAAACANFSSWAPQDNSSHRGPPAQQRQNSEAGQPGSSFGSRNDDFQQARARVHDFDHRPRNDDFQQAGDQGFLFKQKSVDFQQARDQGFSSSPRNDDLQQAGHQGFGFRPRNDDFQQAQSQNFRQSNPPLNNQRFDIFRQSQPNNIFNHHQQQPQNPSHSAGTQLDMFAQFSEQSFHEQSSSRGYAEDVFNGSGIPAPGHWANARIGSAPGLHEVSGADQHVNGYGYPQQQMPLRRDPAPPQSSQAMHLYPPQDEPHFQSDLLGHISEQQSHQMRQLQQLQESNQMRQLQQLQELERLLRSVGQNVNEPLQTAHQNHPGSPSYIPAEPQLAPVPVAQSSWFPKPKSCIPPPFLPPPAPSFAPEVAWSHASSQPELLPLTRRNELDSAISWKNDPLLEDEDDHFDSNQPAGVPRLDTAMSWKRDPLIEDEDDLLDFHWPAGVPRVETGDVGFGSSSAHFYQHRKDDLLDFHWPAGVPRIETGDVGFGTSSAHFNHHRKDPIDEDLLDFQWGGDESRHAQL